jgi:hypothetical protein
MSESPITNRTSGTIRDVIAGEKLSQIPRDEGQGELGMLIDATVELMGVSRMRERDRCLAIVNDVMQGKYMDAISCLFEVRKRIERGEK